MAIKLIIKRQGAAAGRGATPDEERTFDEPIITIGNDPAASLRLTDPAIAPEQALIISEGDQPLFINRAVGTRLNGEALPREARRVLSGGDQISIGPYVISFEPGNGFRPAPGLLDDTESLFAGETNARRPAAPQSPPAATPPPASSRPPAPPPPTPEGKKPAAATSFADILDSLRTEEDNFYFQVETATRGRRRVAVEATELVLGWDETGHNVVCGDASHVAAGRAIVRKDWSGVVMQPHGAGLVSVNGEPVEAARRLRNGDRVTLLPPAVSADIDLGRNFFIFYEPASLVVLDALLPSQQMPPPVAQPATTENAAESKAVAAAPVGALVPTPAAVALRQSAARSRFLALAGRKYFGYFTFGEVLLMVCATLAAAALIFLILEYS